VPGSRSVFHVKHEGSPRTLQDVSDLIREAATIEVPLDAARADNLMRFERLLRYKAVPLGLVASGDAGRLRTRHILDCLRATTVVGKRDRSAFDLGTGAGLPGIVVAISCPELEVSLVESKLVRVAFLELAVRELGLGNVQILALRAEELGGSADLCFARAFAPLERSWLVAEGMLGPGGRLVYFAGGRAGEVSPPRGTMVVHLPVPRSLERAGALVIMSRQ